MAEQSLICWLKLITIPRLDNQIISTIFERYTFAQLEQLDHAAFVELGFKPQQIARWFNPDLAIIDRCLSWASKPNCHIITPLDSAYPYLLKQISGWPKILFVEGHLDVLSLPQIAIVGSRNASPSGLALSYQFAQSLCLHEITITSGLALGVDGRAHRGALDNNGKTIAVLGSGLDVIYPKAHEKLAAQIKEQGAVISEFFPWSPPKAEFFPKRNRIISGLSMGVLVVEAALRSGSLITARLALEQDRDVFALPSAIDNSYGKGSNGLIKQGAFLVESVQDILDQVTSLANCAIIHRACDDSTSVSSQELPFSAVLANVGNDAVSVDVLADVCAQPVHEIMMQLLELELQGLVAVVPGGYVRTRRS